MKVLMSWSGRRFDLAGQPKRWMVVASTIVRDEVKFRQETLLKKLKSRWKRVTGSIFSVEKLGDRVGEVSWK